jgi:glycosyltransferase involved in cell wall biosynthesis
VVAQISTLRPHKGHRVLLDAAKLVLEQAPKTRFLVVGFARGRDFEYVEALQMQARRLGISERVFIGPYAGSIGDIWCACDIHAHATLFDSLPNAIIEGMSLAKPAVVTAVGGIPDLVTHEETGLVVPPNDPRAFAGAVLRLIKDKALAQRLGAAAHERYSRGYRAEDTAQKLQRLFYEVARAR